MRQRLFIALTSLSIYAYVGYPLLVLLLSRIRSQPVRRGPLTPGLSVIIPAHNEAAILPQKIDSLLAQDYPRDRLEIIVASDGSTDETNEIARSLADRGVRLLDLERGGKAQTLNTAAAAASEEILVFTDANAILTPETLRTLAENFADPTVGGVSANERRQPGTAVSGAGLGERLYWEYDKWLKLTESRVGSMVSASGSLYAIRRDLFRPIQDAAATDDFAISTQVVRAGYRLVFEPDAVTWEPSVAKDEIEFGRRVRIVTRGLRSVYGIRDLLMPWTSGVYALQVWSHKIVRRLVGFFAVGIFALSLSLIRRPVYRLIAIGQLATYLLALTGWLGRRRRWGRKPWFYVPYYFVLSNLAASLGVIQFLRQRRVTIWEPRRDT
jgi:cellulose synthase/poly-beta-1,6-N-acetylglucosamine synthase-like glycosyltransferase